MSVELVLDYQARIEKERFEAAARRDRAMVEQRSPELSPEARVRIWERLHQVTLPRDPGHAILAQVARKTGLALADVQEVQRQRAQPSA